MEALTLLRRLAEQHNYPALREACLDVRSSVTLACTYSWLLADVHLGDDVRRRVARSSRSIAPRFRSTRASIWRRSTWRWVSWIEPSPFWKPVRQENADHALLLARLAWCRLQQGRRDQAMALYRRSLSLRPLLAVYHNLLRLHRDSGRLTDMATCLDAAWRFWAEERINWPDDQRQIHDLQLRGVQLDLWLAQERFEAAEAWVEQQHERAE